MSENPKFSADDELSFCELKAVKDSFSEKEYIRKLERLLMQQDSEVSSTKVLGLHTSALEAMPTPCLIFDQDFSIIYGNKCAKLAFRAKDEKESFSFQSLFSQKEQEETLKSAFSKLLRQEEEKVSIHDLKLYDAYYSCQARLLEIVSGQKVFIASFHDVTYSVNLKQRLKIQVDVFNQIRQSVMAIDADSKIIFWNQFATELYGYTEKEALGNTLHDLFTIDKERELKEIVKDVHNGASYRSRNYVYAKEGYETWIDFTAYPMHDNDGEVIGSYGIAYDCTHEINQEQIENEMARFKAVIFENIGYLLNPNPRKFEGAIRDILHEAKELVSSNQSCLIWLNEDYPKWYCYNNGNVSINALPENYTNQEWFVQLQENDLFEYTGSEDGADDCSLTNHKGLNCFFALRSGNELCGVLVVLDVEETGNPIILETLQHTAAKVAGALEAKRAQERLLLQEEKYRLIAENTSDGIAVFENRKPVYVSPAYCEMFGETEEEIFARGKDRFWEMLHKDDFERVQQVVADTLENRLENVIIEYRALHGNGYYIWCEDTINLVYNQYGRLERSYVVTRDITERKKSSQALQESEAKLKAIFSSIPDMLFIVDRDHAIVQYKAEKEELYEQESELIGKNLEELLPPSLYRQVGPKIEEGAEKGSAELNYELEIPKIGLQYYEARIQRVSADLTLAIIRNVTERVMAQQQLKLFEKVVEQSPSSIIITDLKGNIEYANSQFSATTGYSKEEVYGENPKILKSGDTPEEVYKKLWSALRSGEPWQGEFKNKRKDGSYYWESSSISPVFNEQGEVVKYMSIRDDISALKKLNAELSRLSEVAARISNLVIITDSDYNIEYVNEAFEKTLGYHFNEVVGKKPYQFLYGKGTKMKDIEQLRKGLALKEPFSARVLNYSKSRQPFWLDIDFTFIKNSDGKVERIIAVEKDVTELVKAKNELVRERNLLRTIVDYLPSKVFINDASMSKVLANKLFLEFFGFDSEEDLIGLTYYDIFPAKMAERFERDEIVLISERKSILNEEVMLLNSAGEKKWVLISRVPFTTKQGEVPSIISIFKDITDLKKRQEELEKSLSVVSQQNRQLLSFTYIVSHNLRSHSANISSLINMIEAEQDKSNKEAFFQMLKSSSDNLMETLENLNSVVNIQQNTGAEQTDFSLKQIVLDVVKLLTLEINNAKVEVELAIDADDKVRFNKSYMESIVLNLVSNAVKYSDADKKSFVKISFKKEKGKCILSVADNGLGLDVKRYKTRIFGMYQTFHMHPKAKGLGLFITRSQVEVMGGKIEVEGELGVGSTFTVTW